MKILKEIPTTHEEYLELPELVHASYDLIFWKVGGGHGDKERVTCMLEKVAFKTIDDWPISWELYRLCDGSLARYERKMI